MKQLLYIFILLLLASCENPESNLPAQTGNALAKDTVDYKRPSDKWYDIADLKSYTDNSKFVARLRYEPPFTTNSVIELDEITNGINLCVKQPRVKLSHGDTLKGNRSLAFNQLCYWYVGEEAQKIKALFNKFNNGQVIKETDRAAYLDNTHWQVEIFDHGTYSSLEKDNISKEDWQFIEALFEKVKLKKQNGYSIIY
jgi:hypothetical protein